ncbi:uncharacterized protein LOC18014183 [Eutrema salsugineum]|uniref:uncharacterized protein LOC18014183 n=1 Tax=Eutrema salsugineum TaxID=72664 RepID=UPI000CED4059|nr:uncharacterized protein LOC18014183 [Eutrema salsugineum]
MSSQELKKKEKGKEIFTLKENPSTSFHRVDHFDQTEEVSMYFTEQGIAALLEANKETLRENLELEQSKKENGEKVEGIQEKKSSSSKITPCIFYTSDDKARLRWSSDLHDCFVNAVAKLGGPDKATPKSVREKMEVEGIALHHVKSHLQKFRLGKCNIRDDSDPYNKRFKTARRIIKRYASSSSPRPQVTIRPKVTGAAKPPKKAKEVQGSLYMLIEQDLHLQRCREAERMQMAFAIENNRKMFEAQYLIASMAPSIPTQHRETPITQQPASQIVDHWLKPSSHHFPKRETNPNDPQQPTTIIPQTITSVEDFCNDNMACLSLRDFSQETSNTSSIYEPQHVYTSLIHSTQGNHNYNMAQGFINPYVTIEPQSMPGSSITQQELHLNHDWLIQDSYPNAAFLHTVVQPNIDSLHQGSSSNSTIPLSITPQPIQTYNPYCTYNYPPYNTLEAVKAQLSALQNSSTSRARETPSREINVSSSVSRDEEDPVDMYIDWDKVEEVDIDQLDPVAVLEALGFGV